MESIILSTPYLSVCAILTIILIMFGRRQKAFSFVLPVLCCAMTAFIVVAAMLLGAEILEVLLFSILVFILFLFSFFDGGQRL